jgi:hypothetical protein
MSYDIYAVKGDTSNLLLVDEHNEVLNGGYRLRKDDEGFYIPVTWVRVKYMMKAPSLKMKVAEYDKRYGEEREWGWVCAVLDKARDMLYMPLFDKYGMHPDD